MGEILAGKMVKGLLDASTLKVRNTRLLTLPGLLFVVGYCRTSVGGCQMVRLQLSQEQ